MNFLKKNKYILLLATLFLAQFLIISPIGEFPLNDDWVHAEMAQHWAETGAFRLNPYTGPLLYAQLIYAVGLIKIFGFSFTLLRFSTLALMAGLVFGLFFLLKKYTKNESLAFFGSLLVWLNPLIYSMSFTFMSDVPALAFLFTGLAAFYHGSEKNKVQWFWVGSILVVIGFFIRQTTILLLPAIGLMTLVRTEQRKMKYWAAIIIPGLVAMTIYHWLKTHNLLGEGVAYHEIEDKKELVKHAVRWSVYTALYIGLFLLPLTVSFVKKSSAWLYTIFGSFGLGLVSWMYYHKKELFPYVLNTINHQGLGPMTDTVAGTYVPMLPNWVWLLVSAASGIGLGLLVVNLWNVLKNKNFYISSSAFILVFALLFTGPILIFTGFDRYFMALVLAGALLLILENPRTKIQWASWALLGVMAFYTLSQTQFYMNWNRIRAELVYTAMNKYGAQIDTLDSGYEWTGYHDYWLAAQIPKVYRWPAGSPWWVRFLMININREQVISTSVEEGYSIIEERRIFGLNPNNTLYLLKKNDVQK